MAIAIENPTSDPEDLKELLRRSRSSEGRVNEFEVLRQSLKHFNIDPTTIGTTNEEVKVLFFYYVAYASFLLFGPEEERSCDLMDNYPGMEAGADGVLAHWHLFRLRDPKVGTIEDHQRVIEFLNASGRAPEELNTSVDQLAALRQAAETRIVA